MSKDPTRQLITTGSNPSKNQFMRSIKQVYQNQSHDNEIHRAQMILMDLLLNNFGYVEVLFTYLKYQQQGDGGEQFRNICSLVIKRMYQQMGKRMEIEQQRYGDIVYEFLLTPGKNKPIIKYTISIALEQLFSNTGSSELMNKYLNYTKMQMMSLIQHSQSWNGSTMETIYGVTLIVMALKSCILGQISVMIQFSRMMGKLVGLCWEFDSNSVERCGENNIILLAALQIFEFIQLTINRMISEKYCQFHLQIAQLLNSQQLTQAIIHYLCMISDGQVVLSKKQAVNRIKARILDILCKVSRWGVGIDVRIVEMVYMLFVDSCHMMCQGVGDDNDDGSYGQIVSKSISVLEFMVINKQHEQFFSTNTPEFLLSLFLYCRTSCTEERIMRQQPEVFIEGGEQFTEYRSSAKGLWDGVKSRAGHFIRNLADVDDGNLSIMVQFCVIFVTGSLKISEEDSQILKDAKSRYSQLQFFGLSAKEKLDIGFMVLSVLAEKIGKMEDLLSVVISLLLTNMDIILSISNELVLARLIRLIGYYPIPQYLPHILNLMSKSHMNRLQGMRCFDRILSNHPISKQIYPVLDQVMVKVVGYIDVREHLFGRIIQEGYDGMMRKSLGVYRAICEKICEAFMRAMMELDREQRVQEAVLCLQYVEGILGRDCSEEFLVEIEEIYKKMESVGSKIKQLQDNFLDIYRIMITKNNSLSRFGQQLIRDLSRPVSLHSCTNSTRYFGLLNKFIMMVSGRSNSLQTIYNNLIEYIGYIEEQQYNIVIVGYVIHSICCIILSNKNIEQNTNFIKLIIDIVIKKQVVSLRLGNNQCCWYMFLVLHQMYLNVGKIRLLLIENDIYNQFINSFCNCRFGSKIERKVAVLSVLELLCEQNLGQVRQKIIQKCIQVLNEQRDRYGVKVGLKGRRKDNGVGGRSDGKIIQEEEEQQEQQEELEDEKVEMMKIIDENCMKQEDSVTLVQKLEHPFDSIDQFVSFKRRVVELANFSELSEKQLENLTQILQCKWYNNSVRKVLKIVH